MFTPFLDCVLRLVMGWAGPIIEQLRAKGNRNTIEYRALHDAAPSFILSPTRKLISVLPQLIKLLHGFLTSDECFSLKSCLLCISLNLVRDFPLLEGFCNEFANPEEVYFENCNLRTIQKQFCGNLHKITIS